MKLTPAQRRLLEAADKHGHAFADIGARANAGGAIRRCCQSLAKAGLLTPRAPWQLTPAGSELLATVRASEAARALPKPPALSQTMQRALLAIHAGGGEAHPEKGGWWRSTAAGPRIEFESNWRDRDPLTTNTLKSLTNRKLLEAIPGTDRRLGLPNYRLSPKGIAECARRAPPSPLIDAPAGPALTAKAVC